MAKAKFVCKDCNRNCPNGTVRGGTFYCFECYDESDFQRWGEPRENRQEMMSRRLRKNMAKAEDFERRFPAMSPW